MIAIPINKHTLQVTDDATNLYTICVDSLTILNEVNNTLVLLLNNTLIVSMTNTDYRKFIS